MQFIVRFKFSTVVSHYKLLGVQNVATQDEIKMAYIQLAKEHHPDVNQNSSNIFKDISNAYSILKDPQKRNVYDQTLDINKSQQQSQYSSQNHYTNSENYEQKAYQRQYHSKKELSPFYWSLMGGMLIYSFYQVLVYGSTNHIKNSIIQQNQTDLDEEVKRLTKQLKEDGPFNLNQLTVIHEEIQKIQNQQFQSKPPGLQNNQVISEIRRNNIFMKHEFISDSPHIMAKRKKIMEKEMKDKQFKIEYETWQTVRSGDVSRLQRKSQTQTRKKSKTGDVILEDFAKQHNLKLIKKEREPHSPKALSLEDFEESYI